MRSNRHRRSNSLPEVNLIPMMDVLMTVLTFFILISMTLALEQGVEIQLPQQQTANPQQPTPSPMIVELDVQGVSLNDQPIASAPLMLQVKAYLEKNPKGVVVLKAEPQMPYADVVKLLTDLKATGGERVSLAIE
ncbi:MAG: biopolymer transporter ExbD [Drouetiella hepatica Uher 2000/2452]|jgi:biopolymer transport protein ExbD|uniref:Biopolymer transporter ExbD n=1 Tax=Drouetiella hepatica Uher 2000/2452 TaxID=904376 RepID=A0A951Q9C4_9CYAN|nr:biopolymer transporter ExbD [Drouetiella hepatica Uher 2000/2452]